MFNKVDKINAIWNGTTFAITSCLGLVNFTLNIKSFGSEDFGLFILLSSVFGIGNNLDFGFGLSTIKYIAEAKKQNDFERINRIYISFLVTYFVLGIFVVAIFLLYYILIFSKTQIILNNPIHHDVTLIYYILCFSFFLRYITNFFYNVFEGYAKFIISDKIAITISLFNTFLYAMIFVYHLPLLYLAYFNLLISFLFFSAYFSYSLLFLENIKLNILKFDLKLIKSSSIYGLNIQLSFFINSFIDPLIKYLVGTFLSLSHVTYFETSKKIIDLTSGLIYSSQRGLFNKLSEENATGNLKNFIRDHLYIYSKMSNYYSYVLYGILNPALCLFILIWFKSYESMIIFLIFLLPYSLVNFGGSLHRVMMIDGKGFYLVLLQVINFITIFVFLESSLSILHNYLGLLGYYLSTIISIILIVYYLKKKYDFDYSDYFEKIEFKSLILLNIIVLLQLFLLFYLQVYSTYILIMFSVIYLFTFFKYLRYIINATYSRLTTILVNRRI